MTLAVCVLFMLFTATVSPVTTAEAARIDLDGSVAAKSEYNDNIFFSSNDPEDDFIYTLSPELRFSYATERFNSGLAGRVDALRYQDHDDLDDYESRVSAYLSYGIDQHTNFQSSASWQRDTRTDRYFEETGLVYSDTERTAQSLQASLSRSHTERSTSVFSYQLQSEDYSSSRYNETLANAFSYGFYFSWSERLTLRTFLNYARHDYETAEIDALSGTIGGQWRLAEKWDISLDAGTRWNRSEEDAIVGYQYIASPPYVSVVPVIGIETDEKWGAVLKASLKRTTRHGYVSMDFSHDLQTASGNNNSTERSGLNLRGQHRFDRHWIGRFSSGFYLNKSINDSAYADEIDERSWYLRPALLYEFDRDLSLECSYAYSRIDDAVDDSRKTRNSVFLRLSWTHRFFDE